MNIVMRGKMGSERNMAGTQLSLAGAMSEKFQVGVKRLRRRQSWVHLVRIRDIKEMIMDY